MIKYLNRWFKHYCVFIKTEYKLTKKISFKSFFHDIDKPIIYLFLKDKKRVSKIHRKFSSHHENNGKIKDIKSAIIDWECSALTKPEAMLNARQTYNKFYSHIPKINNILKKMFL